MSKIVNKKVDVVLVGLGWTSSVMAMELAETGLEMLALERGEDRDTVPDFAYPKMADELSYAVRLQLMQNLSSGTVTVRRNEQETALPYRSMGAFLPGTGVGGSGIHWGAYTFRPLPEELRLYSYVKEKFGAETMPADMTIQDYPVSYEELEPYITRFEQIVGISGIAGNVNGKKVAGGNPFEGYRSAPLPLPPLKKTYNVSMFEQTVQSMGYHPYPTPAGIASQAYTNPYGMQLGPCNFCGFCDHYGCLNYSKASPQTCVMDALKRYKNFKYKTGCEVTRVNMDSSGKKATGVTYVDTQGNEVEQPADLVILGAFPFSNVRLLLLSGIGKPYEPAKNSGVVGRNFAYQSTGGATLTFPDKAFNTFIGAGANSVGIDDFATSQIDFKKEGFIGGAIIKTSQSGSGPIKGTPVPAGTPKWGSAWKKAVKENYGHTMSIEVHGSNMSYKNNYLDLDPTYKDRWGNPLLRMNFNWHDNDMKMLAFMKARVEEIAKKMNPASFTTSFKKVGEQFDVRPYQTTHVVGGAVMGDHPSNSVVNKYMQSWDVPNLFVIGASAFPQNIQYNPTGLVGALVLYSAKAIREQYLKSPAPLVELG
ncbi:GMC family oxidoreductase [Rouxiella sp. Mn2063]|uniref:GMC family oxidoreductase n=1 Tax=Rouxiella sp. Mn2063 TaxID=3395262 RepID=UPI003BBBEAFF